MNVVGVLAVVGIVVVEVDTPKQATILAMARLPCLTT